MQGELTELGRVLTLEASAVRQLTKALLGQRAAMVGDDPDGMEICVQGIRSSLLTMEEARRARGRLLEVVAGDPDLALGRLELMIRTPLPTFLCEARAALWQAAEGAAREAAINCAVLRQAIAGGEASLQALLTAGDSSHGPREREQEPGGSPFDQTV